jgi:hypothetical protein
MMMMTHLRETSGARARLATTSTPCSAFCFYFGSSFIVYNLYLIISLAYALIKTITQVLVRARQRGS